MDLGKTTLGNLKVENKKKGVKKKNPSWFREDEANSFRNVRSLKDRSTPDNQANIKWYVLKQASWLIMNAATGIGFRLAPLLEGCFWPPWEYRPLESKGE